MGEKMYMTSKQIEKPHWKVKKRNRQSLFKSLQKREQEGEKNIRNTCKAVKARKASFFSPLSAVARWGVHGLLRV